MEKLGRLRVWQGITWLVCAWLIRSRLDDFGTSEFSGGALTGKLYTMAEASTLLFVVAVALTISRRRIGAAVALTATLLCLPFYFHALMPGAFQRIWKGEYSLVFQKPFAWGTWAAPDTLCLLIAAVLSLRGLFAVRGDTGQIKPSPEG